MKSDIHLNSWFKSN